MLRKTLAGLLMASGVASLLAVPAKHGLLEYPQPDGTRVQVRLTGDEFGGWYETEDGFVLLPAADGTLEYARPERGSLVSTGIMARPASLRSQTEQDMLSALPRTDMLEMVAKNAKEASVKARAPRRAPATGLINNYPTVGSPKAMVLLVEFDDVHFSTPDTRQAFQDLASKRGYDHNGATGSALDYFQDQSHGLFSPDFHVFGPIRVDKGESYYGTATAMMYDQQAWKMVEDACRKLHEQQPDLDWSEYDNDGDGFVDNIFVFYAGYGQNEGAPSWTIWPHSANLYTYYNIVLEYNGVKVGNYACTNELRGTSGTTRTGIGTMVHEYSHVLGLPDLYPTNNSGAFTPGDFEVMDHGSYNNQGNTPPNYSSFNRYSVGWLNPRVVSTHEDISLPPMEQGGTIMMHCEKEGEYYIFENRQKSGWDAYIPGHGMLAWHIDFDKTSWIANTVNNDTSHQRVDLVEADNNKSSDTRAGDPFPGSANIRRFTSTTSPGMTTWTGYDMGLPITDINETPEGIITFKVGDGGESLLPVKALEAEDITPVSFTARWQQATGAYTYEIDVCRGGSLVPFRTLKAENATSLEVSDLEPLTEYSYVVRSMSGGRRSPDSNRVSLTTLPPSFGQRMVEHLPATDISHEGFTANWSEVDDAAGYLLTVTEKTPVDPLYQTVDFTKDADGNLLPQGWTTTSTTTGSLKGYYGEAAPALRLTNSGDRLTSPTLTPAQGDVNSLTFWMRGNGTGEDASLLVEALVEGKWQTVVTLCPVSKTEAATVTISGEEGATAPMPQGAKSVRLTFDKESSGSLFVDDIRMGYGATYLSTPLPGYEDADQGSATSARISGLRPLTSYYVTLKAYDASGARTLAGEEAKVTTLAVGGLDTLLPIGVKVATLKGEVVITAPAGTAVSLYTPAGHLQAEGTVPTAGTLRLPAPAGLYILAPWGCTLLTK